MSGRPRLLCGLVLLLGVCLSGCRSVGRPQPDVPGEQIQVLLGRRLEAQELVQQALACEDQPAQQKGLYLRALDLDPTLGQAHNNLALLYLAEGNHGEALRLLREASQRLPGSAVPRFNAGHVYELVGRLQSAEEQYAAAVTLAPDEPDYLESLARVHIRRRDRLDDVEDLLRRALELETRTEHVKWINRQLEALETGFIP